LASRASCSFPSIGCTLRVKELRPVTGALARAAVTPDPATAAPAADSATNSRLETLIDPPVKSVGGARQAM
jgi:hypothetical protein